MEISCAVTHCLVCESSEQLPAPAAQPNLYSEQLALLTGESEARLLANFANVQCGHCGLIYKRRWFQAELLQALFQGAVATHPRGWDVLSKRFTHANFADEIALFEHALTQQDSAKIARYKRALSSIVDSMLAFGAPLLKTKLQQAIDQHDFTELRRMLPSLHSQFNTPYPFKRFSGYSEPALWLWFQEKLGHVERYAEIGCPLWGFLGATIAQSAQRSLLTRNEPNYWGKSCKNAGSSCVSALKHRTSIQEMNFEEMPANQFNLIGMFQYLDHVQRPLALLQTALKASSAVALIVDSTELPCAIQHISAWPERAISVLAQRLNCRIYTGFTPILGSGNDLYLLQQRK